MTELPAIHFEGVKYAYRQSKDGIVVSFVVHPQDVPAELSTSAIGARYMVALVEIGDDEKPKAGKPKKERKEVEPAHVTKGKQNWRDMLPAQQAGIRCEEPAFAAFLSETFPDIWREHGNAADFVRGHCVVQSRAELTTNHKARILWLGLDGQYQAWKALEHA